AIPALLLSVEDLMEQVVRQRQPGTLPRLAVDVHVVHLVLAHAAYVFLERKQDILQDLLRLGRAYAQRRLDAWPKIVEDTQQVVGRVAERDESPAVVEQNAVHVTHPHILIPNGEALDAHR